MAKSKKVAEVAPVTPAIDRKYCCYKIRAAQSKIHRWGLYADQKIPANRKVMEYRGEKIGPKEAEKRALTPYLFVLDAQWTIDGGVGGSGAELVNHSCSPNLVSRIMKGHIIYMSLRAIQKGEELTVDYNYDETDETMNCLCGTEGCRGVINRKE
jgi:SET domain-containing protein